MASRFARGVALAIVFSALGSPARAGLYQELVLADSPVRYYRLGEAAGPTAFDLSPYGGHGSYVNLAAGDYGRPGALQSDTNTSVLLNGTNAMVTAPDAPELDITGDITIEFWYRKTAEATDWQRIVGKGNCSASPSRRNYGVWEENGTGGRLLFQQYSATGSGVLSLLSTTSVGLDVWTHVAATVSGNTARIYMNGALSGIATRTGVPGTNNDPLTIGYGQLHHYFPGYVDEVAVYNQALPLSRVRQHYFASFPQPTSLSQRYDLQVLGSGANAYYRFDDPSSANGATVFDSAGSNHATYRGSVTLVPSELAGAPGNAALFNGSTDYIWLPTAPFGAYPTSGSTTNYLLSFETWFKTTGSGVILGQTNAMGTPGGATPTGYVPAIYVDTAGRVRASMFWHGAADATRQIVSPLAYNDGEWHHLVNVYNNGTEYLYLDGTLIGQQVWAEFAYSSAYYYYLGTGYAAGTWPNTNGGWFFFGGMLDETAFYPRALTLAEVSDHYRAGLVEFELIPEPASLGLLGLGLALLAVALACAGGGQSARAALVGYWPFDGSASDFSGNSNNATLAGGAGYAAGYYGQALALDGSSGYAWAPDSPSLRIGPYTVSAWIRPELNDEAWTGIVGKPGRNYNMWLGNSNVAGNSFIHHRWRDASGTNSGASDAYTIPMDTWSHVAIVNDGAVGRTYINGVLRGQGNVNGSLLINNTPLYFGRDLDGLVQRWFQGRIDDVAIWNQALPAATIEGLSNGTVSPADFALAARARLTSSGSALVMGGAYAENLVTGQISGPVTWQIHRIDVAPASAIAYVVPAGQAGNQTHTGALGMDFDVNQPITITQLGVFDDNSDGLTRAISVRLYDRTATATPLVTLGFSPGEGTLVGGSRFKSLSTPLSLSAGFQGCIVADGYGTGERNGNAMGGTPSWTTDSGGGTLSFVGLARFHTSAGVYPTTIDGGPANRYAAGTFRYDYSNYTVAELLAEGSYNVGDPVNDGLFFYLGNRPGPNYLRLTVRYQDQEVLAFAWVTGVPEPATCALLAAGLLGLLARRRRIP